MTESSTSSKRILDVRAVQQILPHRYPFLLVDRILELEPPRVVGMKAVTVNEPYFQGHFPGRPVMPGVLIVEGMGQTGAAGVLSELIDPDSTMALAAVDDARFRRPVLPGDELIYQVTLEDPRRGFVRMEASAAVDGEEVAGATITLAIQPDDSP